MKLARTRLPTVLALFLVVATNVQAADLLGLYVGAGGGRADLRADPRHDFDSCSNYNCSDAAVAGWTAFVGIQPLPFLGAELQYLDFGHTTQEVTGAGNDPYTQRARALAIFATGTVPLPWVELYGKVGAGRVRRQVSDLMLDGQECILHYQPGCILGFPVEKTVTRFGWGLGAQLKLPISSFALRGEYVRFSAPDGDPDLLSVALLWKF